MLDRDSINMIVTAVLDSPAPAKRGRPSIPLRDLIQSSCAHLVHDELVEYLGRFEQYIGRVSNRRKFYLHDEVEDCKQFVFTQLIKNYHKKYSYSDWEKVTSSVIKRKIIDFVKTRNCNKKSMVLEADLKTEDDERGYLDFNSEFITERSLDMSPDKDMLKTLQADLLADCEVFDKDDRALLKKLFGECENNPFGLLERLNRLNKEDSAECVYRPVLAKIKKYFKINEYL